MRLQSSQLLKIIGINWHSLSCQFLIPHFSYIFVRVRVVLCVVVWEVKVVRKCSVERKELVDVNDKISFSFPIEKFSWLGTPPDVGFNTELG